MKIKSKTEFFVYILICENGYYYTGYTTNVLRRYQEHLNGSGKCRYTKSNKPTQIAQCWQVLANKGTAMKIEHFIKSLTRKQKDLLIKNPEELSLHFPVILANL